MDAGATTIDARMAFDRDTDGQLSASEQRALQAFLLERALRSLRVRIDGRSLRLEPTQSGLVGDHRRVDDGRPLQLWARFEVARRGLMSSKKGVEIHIFDDASQQHHVPVSIRYAPKIWSVQRSGRLVSPSIGRPFAVYRQNPLQIEVMPADP
ncbi:MAG: hypothetical protein AAFV29_09045, partial [Myxococcota bacterium]